MLLSANATGRESFSVQGSTPQWPFMRAVVGDKGLGGNYDANKMAATGNLKTRSATLDGTKSTLSPAALLGEIIEHFKSISPPAYTKLVNAALDKSAKIKFSNDSSGNVKAEIKKIERAPLRHHWERVNALTVEALKAQGAFNREKEVNVFDIIKNTQTEADLHRAQEITLKIGKKEIKYCSNAEEEASGGEKIKKFGEKIFKAIRRFADEQCEWQSKQKKEEFILKCVKSMCSSGGQSDVSLAFSMAAGICGNINGKYGTGIVPSTDPDAHRIIFNMTISEDGVDCTQRYEHAFLYRDSKNSNMALCDIRGVESIRFTSQLGEPQDRKLVPEGTFITLNLPQSAGTMGTKSETLEIKSMAIPIPPSPYEGDKQSLENQKVSDAKSIVPTIHPETSYLEKPAIPIPPPPRI
jgi:hypothetical protein